MLAPVSRAREELQADTASVQGQARRTNIKKVPGVGIRFCHAPDAEPVSVRDHYQALRALANRLVGILYDFLRTRTLYNEHLAWHNEPDKLSPAA